MIKLIKFETDWCVPCKKYEVHLKKLEQQRDDVVIERINIEEKADAAIKYGVQSVPTTIFFNDKGEPLGQRTGPQTLKELNKIIDSLLDKSEEE